jgi:HEAT repeat protein
MDFDQEIAEHLRQLRDLDAQVRSSAAGWLGALGSEGTPAIAPLYEACRDENMYVRGEALHSLVEITQALPNADAWPLLVAGVPTLTALLDDPWLDVRCSAMSMLGEIANVKEIGPAAGPALQRLRALLAEEKPTLTEHPEGWDLETEVRILRESAAEAIAAIAERGLDAAP